MLINASRTNALAFWRLAWVTVALSSSAAAQQNYSHTAAGEGGVSAIWIFANLSFTGMRAQDAGGIFWKFITFILGFPGTLLTLLLVRRGSERAYGIDMPRRRSVS
jgi:hypothetical protein